LKEWKAKALFAIGDWFIRFPFFSNFLFFVVKNDMP